MTDDRIYQPENKHSITDWLSDLPRPLVFTNGCFDILHRGHVHYLAKARALGKSLVVGLNSDDSVKRLDKGPSRPINCLEDRLALVASLRCVDRVVGFDQDTPLNLILDIRPEVLVKGGDWVIPDIVGVKEVSSWGGSVHSLAFEFDHSTTSLLARIKDSA